MYEFKHAQSNSKTIIATFLDFQRAFETIEPKILLNKLKMYGIKNNENKWFKSYLMNRKQYVKVKNPRKSHIA